MHAFFSRTLGLSFSQENLSRFSWPVLFGVLLVHAALLAWLAKEQTPAIPVITPPIIGFLISPPSTTGNSSLAGNRLPPLKKAEQKPQQKRANRPVTSRLPSKKQADSSSKKPAETIQGSKASLTGISNGENDGSRQTQGTGKGSGTGTGAFFSPRIDAAFANNPKPPYPAASRRMGEEGLVILAVHILETGRVAEIRLKKSSGYPRLDKAATATVKQWRYIPARQGNTPVPFWHTQAIKFSLTD